MNVRHRCIQWHNGMVSQARFLEVWLEKIVFVSQSIDIQVRDSLMIPYKDRHCGLRKTI